MPDFWRMSVKNQGVSGGQFLITTLTKLRNCPCCGTRVDEGVYVDRRLFTLGPFQERILRLLRSAPNGLDVYQLQDLLYQGHALPSSPNVISVMKGHINKKLKAHGLAIESTGGRGSVYRLVETVPPSVINEWFVDPCDNVPTAAT